MMIANDKQEERGIIRITIDKSGLQRVISGNIDLSRLAVLIQLVETLVCNSWTHDCNMVDIGSCLLRLNAIMVLKHHEVDDGY